MKKNILGKIIAAFTLLAAASLMSGCEENMDNPIPWSDIQNIQGEGIYNHVGVLELGQSVQLTTTPADIALDWQSSNEAVATISEDGVLTAVGLGEAFITVYPKQYDGVANGNYIYVTVVDKSVVFIDDAIDQSEAE